LLSHRSLPGRIPAFVPFANPADTNSGACNPFPGDLTDKEIRRM
jgi:hypothetical protein